VTKANPTKNGLSSMTDKYRSKEPLKECLESKQDGLSWERKGQGVERHQQNRIRIEGEKGNIQIVVLRENRSRGQRNVQGGWIVSDVSYRTGLIFIVRIRVSSLVWSSNECWVYAKCGIILVFLKV